MSDQKYLVYGLIAIAGLALAWIVNDLSDGQDAESERFVSRESRTAMAPQAREGRIRIGSLTVTAPTGWKRENPASSMRAGQFRLSAASAESDDAELAVFSGIGGSVEENLQRWFTQFSQPDGSSSKEKARISSFTVDEMTVTMAGLSGTFAGSGMMGAPAQEKSGYRLLAAIVEAPDDFYYFKLVGPEETLASWAESFGEFISSIRQTG
ncbi:MAG: hypothetical protein QF613_06880 [Candidatus Marinimicrobia bacterium]|nr:hypothetical protein [Candidatus Neomarinimicrobiota bacterium]